MSQESAEQFVARMKEDKKFRRAVQGTADLVAFGEYLRSEGFAFNQRELVAAMAACMAELDAMAQVCRQ